MRTKLLLAVGCLAYLVSWCPSPASAARLSDSTLRARAIVAKATSERSATPVVAFDGGYYDSTTREVYIDQGARVATLQGSTLQDAPVVDDTPTSRAADGTVLATKAAADCPGAGQYVHCETVTCQSASLWLNYVNDDFSRAYLTVYRNNSIHIRDADGHGYRMVPPRGVRAYRGGRWAFISANCVSGGFSN